MGFLAPLGLAALPLLGIILALYLLKLRRPQAPVASLHLWGSLTRDREANSLWQRLRVSALLLLQLLALLLLVLALARPWLPSTERIGQHAIIVVDVSASMSAPVSAGVERCGTAQARVHHAPTDRTAGALAARLHGFPRVTADADITPARDPGNLERLAAALRELDARVFTGACRRASRSTVARRCWPERTCGT